MGGFDALRKEAECPLTFCFCLCFSHPCKCTGLFHTEDVTEGTAPETEVSHQKPPASTAPEAKKGTPLLCMNFPASHALSWHWEETETITGSFSFTAISFSNFPFLKKSLKIHCILPYLLYVLGVSMYGPRHAKGSPQERFLFSIMCTLGLNPGR